MRRLAAAALRWLLFLAVFAAGFLAFLSLCGDSETMGLLPFALWKAGSLAALALSFGAGRFLYRRGLFPASVTRELDRATGEEA